jgi:hypothetical protein
MWAAEYLVPRVPLNNSEALRVSSVALLIR